MDEPEQLRTAYYITDWDLHYEINSKGSAYDPQTPAKATRRAGALPYVRLYVGGPKGDGEAYQEVAWIIRERYGEDIWPVAWGLFVKLLELAAKQEAGRRGWLVGRRDMPLLPERISALTCFTQPQVEAGLRALMDPDVNWLRERALRELPGNGGGASQKTGVRARESRGKLNSTNSTQPTLPERPGAERKVEEESQSPLSEEAALIVRKAGVEGPLDGLGLGWTVANVLHAVSQRPADVRSPAGWLHSRLAGSPPEGTLTPQQVVTVHRMGLLGSINGVELEGRWVGWNSQRLVVRQAKDSDEDLLSIPVRELGAAVFA